MDNRAGRVVVVGGGAAGFFGAIACAEQGMAGEVLLLEATRQPLDKVRISGGGRCNVTHNCFDPALLVTGYPRGNKELRGPFSRFQPRDTIEWFERRGVPLKSEPDGRVFPVSDDSASIVNCLREQASRAGVIVRLGARVTGIEARVAGEHPHFRILIAEHEILETDRVLLATGNSIIGHRMAAALGHTIEPCVPSLFTFKVDDPRLRELSGVSAPRAAVRMKIGTREFAQQGPLLITHWGLSGPAVLKLSAWGARELAEAHYKAEIHITWDVMLNTDQVHREVARMRVENGRKTVRGNGLEPIPRRLWGSLATHVGISEEVTWSNLSKVHAEQLATECTSGRYEITGKGIFKEEFVTCGGVRLGEVDFRTMQSRVCPGLHLAGEILDIDGITGGYNFQSAWTTGWIAGQNLAEAT